MGGSIQHLFCNSTVPLYVFVHAECIWKIGVVFVCVCMCATGGLRPSRTTLST